MEKCKNPYKSNAIKTLRTLAEEEIEAFTSTEVLVNLITTSLDAKNIQGSSLNNSNTLQYKLIKMLAYYKGIYLKHGEWLLLHIYLKSVDDLSRNRPISHRSVLLKTIKKLIYKG